MKKRILLILGMVLAMAIGLAACGGSDDTGAGGDAKESEAPSPPAAQSAVTVTDMTGREVTVEEPIEKVVALTASDCEILYAIGAGDTLVGRGTYCDYPPEALDIPAVESGYNTNVEQIIDLKPQVLLMSTMAQSKEQIDIFESSGIKVVVSDAKDIDGVYTAVNLIGTLMGKEDQAETVISSMRSSFDELSEKAKTNDDDTKTVYFEVSPLEYGLMTAGKGTFMNEIAEMLGLKNVFDDVDGYAEISEEQVIERNPDYIVTITMYFGDGPTPVDEIMSRSGWEDVTAVRNSDILNLVNNELSRPAPRLVEGAQLMYDFVYGEAVEDES